MTRASHVLLSLLVAVPCSAVAALADEVRLKDGRILVGPTKTVGKQLEVETEDGTTTVLLDDVARVRTADELRLELMGLAANAGDSAFAHLQLARQARAFGLREEMWQHLGRAFQRELSDDLDRRVREFCAGLEPLFLSPHWRKATVDVQVRELLARAKPGMEPARRRALEAVLAAKPDAAPALRQRARGSGQALQRALAVNALWLRGDAADARFVYRTAIVDGASEVRQAAARIVRAAGRANEAADYLAPGLVHDDVDRRLRTAEALGLLSGDAALGHLVGSVKEAALKPAQGGGGFSTRGHIAVTRQTSYIRDFDVEIAQAAAIANPMVDVINDGTVLDVTVHAVTTTRYVIVDAFRGALRRAAGEDPGGDTDTWADWLKSWRARHAGPAPATPTTAPADKN
jgi:hypothetical protein